MHNKISPVIPTSATSGIPIASISLMSLIAVDRDMLNSCIISDIVKWERLLIYRIIVLIRSIFSFWSPKQYHFLTWFKGIINVSDEKVNRLINKKEAGFANEKLYYRRKR